MNLLLKLSGFADEIDPNFDEQLATLRKFGISSMEIRGVDGKGIDSYTLDEVRVLKQKLDAAGISVSSVGSPVGKKFINEDFAPQFEAYKHVVAIAKILDTRNIRMFSFFIPEGEDPASHQQEVFDRLHKMVDYAEEQDVILLHENEKEIYGDTAPRCVELMQELYGEHFKAVFDFANFVQCKQDTLEAYELLKPYIAYIHIKDARWEDGMVVPAGQGDGHVSELLGRFQKTGYQGYLSLEPHLSDFTGLQNLEQHAEKRDSKLNGKDSFHLALTSLTAILEDLDWRISL